MNCKFCNGDLDADPLSLGILGKHTHRCSEHDSVLCPWCFICQSMTPTAELLAHGREHREAIERVAAELKA
jgi:hypothetical protein